MSIWLAIETSRRRWHHRSASCHQDGAVRF